MTCKELAKSIFPEPEFDDAAIEHIIWARTGFPAFWNIGVDGDTPLECFHTQLLKARLDWEQEPCKIFEDDFNDLERQRNKDC